MSDLTRMAKREQLFHVALARCEPHNLGAFGDGWALKAELFGHYADLTGLSRPTIYSNYRDIHLFDEAKVGVRTYIRRKDTQDALHLWPAVAHMMSNALSIVATCEHLSSATHEATFSVERVGDAMKQHPTILAEYRERLENAIESVTQTRAELRSALKAVSE